MKMIELSFEDANIIRSVLIGALTNEECFATNPDIGESACFHCQVNRGIESLEQAFITVGVCYKCGQHFAVHNDDGSCVQD